MTYEDLQAIDFPPYPQDLEIKGLEYHLFPELREKIKEMQKNIIEKPMTVKTTGIIMTEYVEKVSV